MSKRQFKFKRFLITIGVILLSTVGIWELGHIQTLIHHTSNPTFMDYWGLGFLNLTILIAIAAVIFIIVYYVILQFIFPKREE